MTDIFSKEKRSEIMSKIRSKNTKPELVVRKFLHSKGFRYRLHKENLPGKPDLVLLKYNTVILVHGCFWHGHKCKIGSGSRKPKSNKKYWNPKLAKNIERDEKNLEKLKALGWYCITIWECETKDESVLSDKLSPLFQAKQDLISLTMESE